MKKVICFILSLLTLSACDKLFLDVEGTDADLQGKWQLTSADTVYFNFQKNLFQFQIYVEKDSLKHAFGYYLLAKNDSIRLELARNTSQYPLDNLAWHPFDDEYHQTMVYKNFRIDLINSKKLVLSSGNEMLTFRKF
jgi:hypothetical protein